LGVAEGFFGYNSPKLERIWMKPEYKFGTTVCTCIKNLGEISPGIPPNGTETVPFLSHICYWAGQLLLLAVK